MLDATKENGGQEQGLNVSMIQSFLVSKCQRFNDPILPNFNFAFLLTDIDLISKLAKVLVHGSSGFGGARFFQSFQNL